MAPLSESGKAVFLSYASQDAAAAKRVGDGLRAAGVEVWFDVEGGLETGDEWDAKIRKQIRECVLFLPIISANTQAREEGYFRLEWDLAAERARTIASGVPFILPVVIDDTREPDALVPDRFRTLQWTRLKDGLVPPEVMQRFLKLWSHRTGVLKQQGGAAAVEVTSPRVPGRAPVDRFGWRTYAALAAAICGLMAGVVWWRLRPPQPAAAPVATAPVKSEPERSPRYASSRPEVAALLTRAMRLTDKADVARAELETALTLLEQASRLDPADASVWAEWALVERRYVHDNLDSSPARVNSSRQHAKQAVTLDPANPHARLADAVTMALTNRDRVGREAVVAILAPLVAAKIDRAEAYVELSRAKVGLSAPAEAFAVLEQAAQMPALAGRATFQKAVTHAYVGEWGKADAALDEALALERSAQALQWKAYLSTIWNGNAAAGQSLLQELPPAILTEDYPASTKVFCALWAHDFDTVITALRAVPRDYTGSGALSGPTGYYLGYALARQGKKSAAEVEWRSALEVVNTRLKAESRDRTLLAMKTLLLHAVGEPEEAARVLAALRELHPEYLARSWEGHILATQVLPPEEAVEVIRTSAALGLASGMLNSLRLNPFVDRIRDHPKFRELMAEVEANPKLNPAAVVPPSKADEKSVAVLAFANHSDDKGNEYFSDGVSEELLNVLAKIPELKVTARTSAFYFKGKDTPIPEIARQLGVAYVVEGSVRKAGDKVRITAQLIKASDGFQVWSDTFTRDLKDIFAVQDEIAGLVVTQLRAAILDGKTPAAAAEAAAVKTATVGRTANVAAYQLFLEGKFLLNLKSPEGIQRSIGLFKRCVEADPEFALAWANLAFAYNWAISFGVATFAEVGSMAGAAGDRAVRLAPELAEAHAAAGDSALMAWRWPDAAAASDRALQLAPGNADVLQSASWRKLVTGDLPRSIELSRAALRVDPYNLGAHTTLGMALLFSGRPEEAERVAAAMESISPGNYLATILRWNVLVQQGRWAEARAMSEAADPANRAFGLVIVAFGEGREAESTAELARLQANPQGLGAFDFAIMHAFRGERDAAFAQLEKSRAEHSNAFVVVKSDPMLKNLHRDPRWPELLRSVGLATNPVP